MRKTIIILILLTAVAYSQGSSVDTVYSKPVRIESLGPCTYTNYFYVPVEYIDSVIADKNNIVDTVPGWDYFNSDEVKDQIKLQLRERLHSGRLHEVATPGQYAFAMKQLMLVSIFIFPDSLGGDFYLLEYKPYFRLRSDHPSPSFFAGYTKYADSVVMLGELYPGMAKDNFNYLIDNSNNLREMDPLCKSALLLRLIYNAWIAFPESFIELAYAVNIHDNKRFLCTPLDVISPADLFLFNITENYKDLNKKGYLRNNESYFDNPDFGVESDIPIKFHAPEIKFGESYDSVSVVVFCPGIHELAEWAVVFDKTGSLKSIIYKSKPYHFDENFEDRSPYNYFENDFGGDN